MSVKRATALLGRCTVLCVQRGEHCVPILMSRALGWLDPGSPWASPEDLWRGCFCLHGNSVYSGKLKSFSIGRNSRLQVNGFVPNKWMSCISYTISQGQIRELKYLSLIKCLSMRLFGLSSKYLSFYKSLSLKCLLNQVY